jgi:hypothetical protein
MANVQLTDSQRAVLRALANTVVPSLDRPEDPTGFWRLCGCDLKADAVVAEGLLQLPEEQRAGVLALLDGLHVLGFATGSRRSCEQLMRNVALMGAQPAAGMDRLVSLMLAVAYAGLDPQARCTRARGVLRAQVDPALDATKGR